MTPKIKPQTFTEQERKAALFAAYDLLLKWGREAQERGELSPLPRAENAPLAAERTGEGVQHD